MFVSVTKQLIDFLLSILVGGLLGAVYDIFRISRLATGRGRLAIFFQDIFFFLLCAVVTFLFLLVDNSGEVRAFLLLGELLGALLYYFTLGSLVMRCAKKSVGPAKRAVRKAVRAVERPAIGAARALGMSLQRNGETAKKICVKGGKVFRIRLQDSKKMLYNQRQSIMRYLSAPHNAQQNTESQKNRKHRRQNAHAKEKKA